MNGYPSLHAGSGSGWGSLSLALHPTPGINPLSLSQRLSFRNGSPSPPTSLFPQPLLTFARQGILQIRSLPDPDDTPESYNHLNGSLLTVRGTEKQEYAEKYTSRGYPLLPQPAIEHSCGATCPSQPWSVAGVHVDEWALELAFGSPVRSPPSPILSPNFTPNPTPTPLGKTLRITRPRRLPSPKRPGNPTSHSRDLPPLIRDRAITR